MRLLCLFLLAAPLFAQDVHVRVSPAVTTGIHGTNEFPTIQNALGHHPFAPAGYRVVIAIEPGVYHERIDVTQNHKDVTLLGMGPCAYGPADEAVFAGIVSCRQGSLERRGCSGKAALEKGRELESFVCALYAF